MGSAVPDQGYDAHSGSYGSTAAFASPAGRNMAKNSDFLKAFGNGPTNTHATESQQTEEMGNRPSNLGFNTNEQSLFDFDPSSNHGSPYQNHNQFGTPDGGIPGWGPDMGFRPLSPPDSASPFSKNWSYGFPNVSNPSVLNIFHSSQPNNARAQYGQVTPPDDDHDEGPILDYPLPEQQQESNDTASSKKRKRGNGSNAKASNQTPAKRSRKNASRKSGTANTADPSKPEDVRRSKFLERNRVAASKCRQKKKEWTQNIENRSRELQKDNNNMRMMVDSLRQEVLFLKGEMLRHSGCDSPQIQDYLKSCANELSGSSMETATKRESSPFESMPRSRMGSLGTVDLDGQSLVDEELTRQGQTNAEIAGDENALEALLTSSINHDTSEEGAARKLES